MTMFLRIACRCIVLAVVGIFPLSSTRASESLTPLGRETTDRLGDLHRRLLELGKADIAEAVCRKHLEAASPGSDESAKWTIRLSESLLAEGIRSGVRSIPSCGREPPRCWMRG
ncbi:MAG: hypothetical protein R3C05_14330 [Pirellulaceae bacterium]